MEYHNGQLCISAREFIGQVVTEANYKQLKARGKVEVAQRGGGHGKCALLVVDTLPRRHKEKVSELYPNRETMKLQEWFRSNYEIDSTARYEFSKFRFDDGSPLPAEKQVEYVINASVIRAVQRLMSNANALRKATPGGGKVYWDELTAAVAFFRKEFGHTLPESALRFRKKVAEFNRGGYYSLISGKFQNQNSRKVNNKIERLLLSIDSLPQRPFNTTVHELYMQFICGELDVYDPRTGELFDPDEFADDQGEPVALSETTVSNYLNKPKNRALRAKIHENQWDYNQTYRPHHNRKHGEYAFSKITLDDRDLPRKMPDGNRAKAYYAYDVVSQAIVGYAHSRLKRTDLFLDCLRNMFRTIDRRRWNCPAEAEVEHHLVDEFSDSLMRAGAVFSHVRFCNPGNSQEKRAEHFNRAKKYGVEKRSQVGIGRPFARLEANRTRQTKIYDEYNDTYKEATYSYEQLVAEDIATIEEYNRQLHPNQKKYPGLSRWEVLCERQNPELKPVDKALLYRYIGERTKTSIRRNMYCTVNGMKFGLPNPKVIERLAPGNYEVTACYMPDEAGHVSEVYLYQDDNYIATCAPIVPYNEATAEQTDADKAAYTDQSKYVSQFDAMIKKDGVQRVRIMPKMNPAAERVPEVVETVTVQEPLPAACRFNIDYARAGLEDV